MGRLADGSRLDVWERRQETALGFLPYLMLVVSVALTVLLPPHPKLVGLDLLLAATAALWMLWLYTLHPAWRKRAPLMATFFGGLVVLMAVLVITDPWFGFFSFTAYFYVFTLSAGVWRVLAVAVIAVTTATSQNGGLPRLTPSALVLYGVIVLVNVVVAGAITWFGWVSEEQHSRRKTMVEELAEANSKLAATLAENAGLHRQLLTQAREAGILDERQRLAREIHDTLAQGLTGIITQLEAADHPGTGPAGAGRHLAAARRLARESLTEARRSVDALRPEQLEGAALPEALAQVTRRWSELTGIRAEVTTTGTVQPMDAGAEAALLRTAQEALANVARHAAATRVGLTLSYMGDEVALDVRDDGRGFDPRCPRQQANGQAPDGGQHPAGRQAPAEGGFGLTAMRQRVEGLAGTLEIESEPGGGTAVCARIPALPPEGAP